MIRSTYISGCLYGCRLDFLASVSEAPFSRRLSASGCGGLENGAAFAVGLHVHPRGATFFGYNFFWGDTTFREGVLFGIQFLFWDAMFFWGYKMLFSGYKILFFFGTQKFLVDQNPKTSLKLQQFKNK